MAPLQRLAFLALRCLRLALDTLADVTLFYVFVVGTLSGADAIADVYSATATPPPQHAQTTPHPRSRSVRPRPHPCTGSPD